MTEVDPAFEKKVKLKIIVPDESISNQIIAHAENIPGVIDISFKTDMVILHYNNSTIGIDLLVKMLKMNKIILDDSLWNKIKLWFHDFVDTNAKSNAASVLGCCAKAGEIAKNAGKSHKH